MTAPVSDDTAIAWIAVSLATVHGGDADALTLIVRALLPLLDMVADALADTSDTDTGPPPWRDARHDTTPGR